MLALRRISTQLESFTLSPGFANSSSSVPPLPPLDFVADAPTRWINILWFLSLIFSLSAALFGILVKQWIREYMQWNSALALPRDNVLVRQVRFEAWNKWNVPATIASIPALLEIALVFFFCGLGILLWTLDPVVSIVITTAASVFVAIASTFTILPAFFERCPYKSPTSWACTIVWDFVTLWVPHAFARLQYHLGDKLYTLLSFRLTEAFGKWLMKASGQDNWRLGNWSAISNNWRARDHAAIWSSLDSRSNLKRGDPTALLDALLSEQSCADGNHECSQTPGVVRPPVNSSVAQNVMQPHLDAALRTITELPPLIRALAWVSQASQDARTQHSVSQCIESLGSRFVLPEPMLNTDQGGLVLTQEGVRAVSIWHLLTSFGRTNDLTTNEDQAALKDISSFRARNVTQSQYPRACSYHGEDDSDGAWNCYNAGVFHLLVASDTSRLAVSMLIYLSALSFRDITEGLLTHLPDGNMPRALISARRATELLITLRSFYNIDEKDPYVAEAAQHLVDILYATNGDKWQLFAAKFPRLRGAIRRAARNLRATWSHESEVELFRKLSANSVVLVLNVSVRLPRSALQS